MANSERFLSTPASNEEIVDISVPAVAAVRLPASKFDVKPQVECGNCGRSPAPWYRPCPARNARCDSYGKRGHCQRCCRKVKTGVATCGGTIAAVATALAACNSDMPPDAPVPHTEVSVKSCEGNTHVVAAVPDTGAEVCVAGI